MDTIESLGLVAGGTDYHMTTPFRCKIADLRVVTQDAAATPGAKVDVICEGYTLGTATFGDDAATVGAAAVYVPNPEHDQYVMGKGQAYQLTVDAGINVILAVEYDQFARTL